MLHVIYPFRFFILIFFQYRFCNWNLLKLVCYYHLPITTATLNVSTDLALLSNEVRLLYGQFQLRAITAWDQ